MVALTAAVIIVGALCVVDLLLTFGVIRRLREHSAMLAGNSHRGGDDAIGLTEGKTAEAFAAADSDGEAVHGPSGLRVVAFFSTTCPVCPERAPVFIDYLRAHGVSRTEVLAVVIGSGTESVPYLTDLTEVARVCAEPPNGAIGGSFAVRGVPAFFLLDPDATVRWSGYDPSALPAPVSA